MSEVFKTPRGSHQAQGFFYKVFLIFQECVKKEIIRYYLLRFLSPLLVRFLSFPFKSLDREAFPCPQLGGAEREICQVCGPACSPLPWGFVETNSLFFPGVIGSDDIQEQLFPSQFRCSEVGVLSSQMEIFNAASMHNLS